LVFGVYHKLGAGRAKNKDSALTVTLHKDIYRTP